MPEIDPDSLSRMGRYRLLTSCIIPRPIAFVTTVSKATGVVNLAPFSFFNGVSGTPPILSLAIGKRAGTPKDTLRNILETREFVVHASTAALAEAVNTASGDYPPEVSEVELLGLETVPAHKVTPPRIVASPMAMECVLEDTWEPEGALVTLVLGRIIWLHLADAVCLPDGTADPGKLDAIGRLGGSSYTHVRDLFEMIRPEV